MISGHESGMFPDSIFLLVGVEWVEDSIEGLDRIIKDTNSMAGGKAALWGLLWVQWLPIMRKKLSIRRLYFGLHVRVGTYISRIETYLRAIQVQHSSRLGWYGILLVTCLTLTYKMHAVGASCYILTQQCSCRSLSIQSFPEAYQMII